MARPNIITGKHVETYAAAEGDNPIATLIESILKDPYRKELILASGDPRKAIEKIKKYITLRRAGQGPNASWMYMVYVPQFDTHFRIMATTRLTENMRYNPF